MTVEATPRLRATNVSKTFGTNRVLSGLNMVIRAGEIHGLVGENGSGKSTFVKILTGYHACDPGATIEVNGREVSTPVSWNEVHDTGVSVVHQDFGLIDHLSVAENISVGGYDVARVTRKISWQRQSEIAEASLSRLNSTVSPTAMVGALSVSHRAAVAMARAIRDLPHGEGLIVLDESTRSLNRDELIEFYEALGREVASGMSVLLVSHNLPEIALVTNRVTVLRDGVVTGEDLDTSRFSEQEIARLMLGRSVENVQRRAAPAMARTVAAEVRDLAGDTITDVSFSVAKGEIVGITGLSGSGFESIPYLMSGARPATQGTLVIGKTTLDLAHASVRATAKAGIALVPERRDRDGLAFEATVRDNIALPLVASHGHAWHLPKKWQSAVIDDATERFDIRPKDPSLLVRQLSGGNQQKALLAKWLSVSPTLLVLHEPTQAVDVGARYEILRQIQNVARDGVAVLIVSVETLDLAEVCDRVLVYSVDGTLSETSGKEPDDILDAVYGSKTAR